MRPPESLEWFLKHAERSERLDGANSFVSCTCWACGSDIRVHLNITSENIYMPPSQCGACGALTDHPDSGPPKISYGQPSALKQVLKVLSSYKQGVVAAVTLLVLTVVTLGSVVILPITCASSYWLWALNQVVTWTFTAFVFFFYASSIYSATSTVKACYGYSDKFPPKSTVPTGCYAGFTFCRDCQWFKPPNAHHCRVCNVCIIKKDHHCVFLNNCVAVGNMRSFLLFLLFTFASIIFCGFHMVLSIVLERSALIAALSKAWAMSKGPRIFLIHINLFLSLKWTLVVAIINLSFSCSILVGVGTLLWFQFVSLSSLPPLDSTATDGKEGQAAGAKPAWSNVIAHLSLIIRGRGGQKSLLLWIWPIWSPNHHESADRLSAMKPKATWCSVDDSLLNSGAIANNKME